MNISSDTKWFRTAFAACHALCFTDGRIEFIEPGGKKTAPTQGQAFFYFGPNVEPFNREFDAIGIVVQPSKPGDVAGRQQRPPAAASSASPTPARIEPAAGAPPSPLSATQSTASEPLYGQ